MASTGSPRAAGVSAGNAVAIGRLSAPANTVTSPSFSMRTAVSAPTRLRLTARTLPDSRLMPERPISAFGALATTVPSASRTTMSRRRNEVWPVSSRSIWVPPTMTVWLAPKFSAMAAFSHGVAMSISIGPLESRHHRPRQPSTATARTLPTRPDRSTHKAPLPDPRRRHGAGCPTCDGASCDAAAVVMADRHGGDDARDARARLFSATWRCGCFAGCSIRVMPSWAPLANLLHVSYRRPNVVPHGPATKTPAPVAPKPMWQLQL